MWVALVALFSMCPDISMECQMTEHYHELYWYWYSMLYSLFIYSWQYCTAGLGLAWRDVVQHFIRKF